MRARILLLVLIGVVVNLAVAWSCALWWPVDLDFQAEIPDQLPPDLAAQPDIRDWAAPSSGSSIGAILWRFKSEGRAVRVASIGVADVVPGDNGGGPERVHRELSAGWPFYSMGCEGFLDWNMAPGRSPQPADWRGGVAVPSWVRPSESGPEVFFFEIPRPLPLRIMPIGFVADTAFYAIVVGGILFGPDAIRGVWRVRRGLCRACAYPIAGLAVCPECGKTVEAGRRENRSAPPT